MVKFGCDFLLNLSAAYPAVYGQFPQAIPQPMSAVPPTQREGKDRHASTHTFTIYFSMYLSIYTGV